jgi:hypothetical protein
VNAKRILLGGVVAALIIAAVETLLFGFILAEPMARARAEKGFTEASWGGPLQLGTTLVPGLILAWLYAAIRPRFGPGPRTALKAGAVLWIATWLMFYVWLAPTGRGLLFMKPPHTAIAMLGELAGVLLAALGAGWIYREDGQV